MIAGLNPYSAYKDSGVSWLGEVPAHWEVGPLRHLIACLDGKRVPLEASVRGKMLGDYPYWGANRIIDRLNDYLFDEDLILLGEDGAPFFEPNRPVAFFSRGKVWPNNHIHVLRPIGGSRPEFIVHALNCTEYESYVSGATRDKLTQSRMKTIPIPIPPLPEQNAIVRFLDHADRRIRRYIRAKLKLIALLEEQKQAIIQQTVTGENDVRTGQPYPAYKPSGVEWLGDVPAHWRLVRLKEVARVQTGLTLGKDYRSRQTITRPYLRVANVQTGRLDLTHVKSIDVPPSEAEGTALLRGDVLMTEGGDIDKLGRGCVWQDEIPGCLHQNHIFAVRCRQNNLLPEFLAGLMASQHGRAYFQLTAKQTTNLASTNSSTLRAFPVPLPTVEDQLSILRLIHEKTNGLDNATDRTERDIDLLREYRTRLIADVVTGKLDVREAAASLPEVDPPAAEDGVDETLADVSEIDGEAEPAEAAD